MIWLQIFLLVTVIVIIYILFAPFYIEINSVASLVRVRLHRLASAQILIEDTSLIIEIRIIGWRKQIDLSAQKVRKEKPVVEKRKKAVPEIAFSKVSAILRSFKVNSCYVNLDFEDVLWNAALFPLFFGLSRISRKGFYINFIGKNEIKLEIENSIIRILWAYISK